MGGDRPDLDDLTSTVVAEWADSWLLIVNRSPARPDEGEYRLGLVAGSRQWSEIDYEFDASFGVLDIDNAGYTQPPQWTVTRVDSARSEHWGKKSSSSAAGSESGIVVFIKAHPFMFTKWEIAEEGPGAPKRNANKLDELIKNATVVSRNVKRHEKNGIKKLRPQFQAESRLILYMVLMSSM
jgi:hypothetical protein